MIAYKGQPDLRTSEALIGELVARVTKLEEQVKKLTTPQTTHAITQLTTAVVNKTKDNLGNVIEDMWDYIYKVTEVQIIENSLIRIVADNDYIDLIRWGRMAPIRLSYDTKGISITHQLYGKILLPWNKFIGTATGFWDDWKKKNINISEELKSTTASGSIPTTEGRSYGPDSKAGSYATFKGEQWSVFVEQGGWDSSVGADASDRVDLGKWEVHYYRAKDNDYEKLKVGEALGKRQYRCMTITIEEDCIVFFHPTYGYYRLWWDKTVSNKQPYNVEGLFKNTTVIPNHNNNLIPFVDDEKLYLWTSQRGILTLSCDDKGIQIDHSFDNVKSFGSRSLRWSKYGNGAIPDQLGPVG